MKTYPNGSKCGYKEMDKIVKERWEMQNGSRRLHSPEVNGICRREVKRYITVEYKGHWMRVHWVIEAISDDLGFTSAQIKTQLKNLVDCEVVEKKVVRTKQTKSCWGYYGTMYRSK